MMGPLGEDLSALEKGMVMYDAELVQDVFVVAPVLFLRGDNVRQAEMALHKGFKAKHPCRYCDWQADPTKPVGANKQSTLLRYDALVYAAESRTAEDYHNFAIFQTTECQTPVMLPD